jgi:hypothetical protein
VEVATDEDLREVHEAAQRQNVILEMHLVLVPPGTRTAQCTKTPDRNHAPGRVRGLTLRYKSESFTIDSKWVKTLADCQLAAKCIFRLEREVMISRKDADGTNINVSSSTDFLEAKRCADAAPLVLFVREETQKRVVALKHKTRTKFVLARSLASVRDCKAAAQLLLNVTGDVSMSWIDGDGDTITISTDEALKEAIDDTNRRQQALCIHVTAARVSRGTEKAMAICQPRGQQCEARSIQCVPSQCKIQCETNLDAIPLPPDLLSGDDSDTSLLELMSLLADDSKLGVHPNVLAAEKLMGIMEKDLEKVNHTIRQTQESVKASLQRAVPRISSNEGDSVRHITTSSKEKDGARGTSRKRKRAKEFDHLVSSLEHFVSRSKSFDNDLKHAAQGLKLSVSTADISQHLEKTYARHKAHLEKLGALSKGVDAFLQDATCIGIGTIS